MDLSSKSNNPGRSHSESPNTTDSSAAVKAVDGKAVPGKRFSRHNVAMNAIMNRFDPTSSSSSSTSAVTTSDVVKQVSELHKMYSWAKQLLSWGLICYASDMDPDVMNCGRSCCRRVEPSLQSLDWFNGNWSSNMAGPLTELPVDFSR